MDDSNLLGLLDSPFDLPPLLFGVFHNLIDRLLESNLLALMVEFELDILPVLLDEVLEVLLEHLVGLLRNSSGLDHLVDFFECLLLLFEDLIDLLRFLDELFVIHLLGILFVMRCLFFIIVICRRVLVKLNFRLLFYTVKHFVIVEYDMLGGQLFLVLRFVSHLMVLASLLLGLLGLLLGLSITGSLLLFLFLWLRLLLGLLVVETGLDPFHGLLEVLKLLLDADSIGQSEHIIIISAWLLVFHVHL